MSKDTSSKAQNQSIYKYVTYGSILSNAINNYQKIFGIKADVYRIADRERGRYEDVFGPSQVSIKSKDKFKFYKTIYILNAPTELYYTKHDNSNPMEIKLGTNDLVVGDIVRIPWVDGNTLDYTVIELPRTIGNMFYIYRVESNFNLNTI